MHMFNLASRKAASSTWMHKGTTSSWLATSKQSSGDDDGEDDDEASEGNASSRNTSNTSKDEGDRKFTQEDIDRVVKKRLKEEKGRISNELREEIEAEIKAELEDAAAEAAGDLQKLLDSANRKIAALESKVKQYEDDKREADLEKLRIEVVADVGLPETAAGYLKGETKEELAASAKELAVTFGVVEAPDTDLGKEGPKQTRRDRFSKKEEKAYEDPSYWTQR